MKITLDILKKNEADAEVLNYFTATFGENAEIDVNEVIAQIHHSRKDFSGWVFKTFKLTGNALRFFESNQRIASAHPYKDGLLHGTCETYWGKTGKVATRRHYENGKLQGPFQNYCVNGNLTATRHYDNDICVKKSNTRFGKYLEGR